MVVGIKFAIIDTVLMMTMVYVFTCDRHRLDSELIIPFNASTKVSIKAGMDRISMHADNSWIYSPEPRTIIMASFAIILCCAFMLVVGTATAYPMRKEKFTNQDFVKAARYFWNENMGRNQLAHAQEDVGKYQRAQEDIMGKYQRAQEDVMGQWNKEAEFEKMMFMPQEMPLTVRIMETATKGEMEIELLMKGMTRKIPEILK